MKLIKRRGYTIPVIKTDEDPIIDDLYPDYTIYEPLDYRDGPEGFIKWCEDMVHIPVYPEGSDIPMWVGLGNLPKEPNPKTGKSYRTMWEAKKDVYRKALRMNNGRFRYRLIVLCWMRGEGKSLDACLIQLWKFMNWPRQMIVLGANSKDQVKFVHYDIIRDIVLNSPGILRIVGKKNIQEKEIRLKDEKGNISSKIMPITSFSGIVSNITGYTFSEIFDMKNPKFFVQLDGSTRNIPNALGVIDSTVSAKNHILYSLYTNYTKGEAKSLYFDYRFSRKGISDDYWNPNMDQNQLNDYRMKFPLGDYERYFLNVWSSSSDKIFSEEMIEASHYIGCDGVIGNYKEVMELINKRIYLEQKLEEEVIKKGLRSDETLKTGIKNIQNRFTPIETIYSLTTGVSSLEYATMEQLNILGDTYDTNWFIMCGIDRADPMKKTGRWESGARTSFLCVAKGLPGSRSRPFIADVNTVPNYLYVLLNITTVSDNSLEGIKDNILLCNSEYDGVDVVCGERWGLWDLEPWCEEINIKLEAIHPTYDRQRAAFSEVHRAYSTGLFKTPKIPIYGSKSEDILKEELLMFHHDTDKRWFGSLEKGEKGGIQDDVIFGLGWCLYGGRENSVNDFRPRNRKTWFGTFLPEKGRLTA
jgi:hypothetical protein